MTVLFLFFFFIESGGLCHQFRIILVSQMRGLKHGGLVIVTKAFLCAAKVCRSLRTINLYSFGVYAVLCKCPGVS